MQILSQALLNLFIVKVWWPFLKLHWKRNNLMNLTANEIFPSNHIVWVIIIWFILEVFLYEQTHTVCTYCMCMHIGHNPAQSGSPCSANLCHPTSLPAPPPHVMTSWYYNSGRNRDKINLSPPPPPTPTLPFYTWQLNIYFLNRKNLIPANTFSTHLSTIWHLIWSHWSGLCILLPIALLSHNNGMIWRRGNWKLFKSSKLYLCFPNPRPPPIPAASVKGYISDHLLLSCSIMVSISNWTKRQSIPNH